MEGESDKGTDRTDDHPTGHLLSVIPLPLMSVLTLPTSFLCSLSLLSRSLRLEVRFSLFTSHLSSDSEPRSGEQRRWVDRRRTDPRKLRQVVRILPRQPGPLKPSISSQLDSRKSYIHNPPLISSHILSSSGPSE